MERRKYKIVYLLFIYTFIFLSISLNCRTSNKLEKPGIKLNEPGIEYIKDDSLKLLISNFEVIHLPFNLNYESKEKEIEECFVNKYLKLEGDFEGITTNYYYGFVLFKEDYFLLITSLYQNQGLSSMQNWPLRIYTFNCDGTLTNTKEIACNCNSLSLGKNEYYATSFDKVIINDSCIIVNEKYIHATLYPDETENPFEEITNDTVYFSINKQGLISKRFK